MSPAVLSPGVPSAAPLPDPFAALRRVPAAVEGWWLARARQATGGRTDDEALERLTPAVAALSDTFTTARPKRFAPYGADPASRAAYGLWFGAQTWVRTRLPLAEAAVVRGWRPPARALRVLDVGAGSGAAGLSAATWLCTTQGVPQVHLTALDHAREPLAALERLAREALPPALAPQVTLLTADARTPADWPAAAHGPWDLIVVAFALNELWPAGDDEPRALLAALGERLSPAGLLLVLEPAVQAQAYRVVRLAADLVEQAGLHAYGPQLSPGAWRPAEDPRTWPHEVRRWQMPASLARVNRRLWRSAAELTFSYALLGRSPPPPPPPGPHLLRLASPVKRAHGRRTWLGFTLAGDLGSYELQQRDGTRAELERLEALDRGDVLLLDPAPRAVGDRLRLASARSVVRVCTPEGSITPWE